MTKYGDSAVTGRICEMFGLRFCSFDRDSKVFILFLGVVNWMLPQVPYIVACFHALNNVWSANNLYFLLIFRVLEWKMKLHTDLWYMHHCQLLVLLKFSCLVSKLVLCCHSTMTDLKAFIRRDCWRIETLMWNWDNLLSPTDNDGSHWGDFDTSSP